MWRVCDAEERHIVCISVSRNRLLWRRTPMRNINPNAGIGLFSTQFDATPMSAMDRWSLRQGFALLLAVFVTVGMCLSVVRANDMAVKMAMMSDMGADGQDDCANCLHLPGKAGAKATFCATVCAAPAIAQQHE